MAARLAVPALLLLLLASSPAAAAGDKGPEKVAVALYYESLCPYSARFVVDRLARVFEDGLLDAVDLTLVPYGNARVHAGGEISRPRPARATAFDPEVRRTLGHEKPAGDETPARSDADSPSRQGEK
jgi:hypothetical protein